MAAATVGLALLTVGCSDGGSTEVAISEIGAGVVSANATDPSDATPTTTATATTEPSTAEDDASAAYLEIMRRYFLRLQQPDPADPDLGRFHGGASLRAVRARAQDLVDQGAAGELTERGAPVPLIRAVEVVDDAAVIENCVIDDVRVVRVDPNPGDGSPWISDEVLDDDEVSQVLRSILVRTDGRWVLREQQLLEQWDDGRGCDR